MKSDVVDIGSHLWQCPHSLEIMGALYPSPVDGDDEDAALILGDLDVFCSKVCDLVDYHDPEWIHDPWDAGEIVGEHMSSCDAVNPDKVAWIMRDYLWIVYDVDDFDSREFTVKWVGRFADGCRSARIARWEEGSEAYRRANDPWYQAMIAVDQIG